MSSADRLKRLERWAAADSCPACRERRRVVYENDWREQHARHEAIGTVPGEELFEIAPVRSEPEARCSRCGRELPIVTVRYIDNWRAGELPEGRPRPPREN